VPLDPPQVPSLETLGVVIGVDEEATDAIDDTGLHIP
jgi:hypothetical protein